MFIYWLVFFIAAVAAFTEQAKIAVGATIQHGSRSLPGWIIAGACLVLIVGLRHEVGTDWFNYIYLYVIPAQYQSLGEVVLKSDPGYGLVNWLSVQSGFGAYGTNLISTTLFITGLFFFCRSQPRPILALVLAIPYMVIVVGMGYNRQAVALGLAMIGLVALVNRSMFWFVFWIILAAAFHKSAVLLIPIAALASSKNKYWTSVWVLSATILVYFLLLRDSIQGVYDLYVDEEMQSQGALIRLLMNAVPAFLFLWYRKIFRFSPEEYLLWLWVSIISLTMLALLVVTPYSTLLDRVALYFLPLQLVVFSRLPEVLGTWGKRNLFWVFLIILYYCLVQFVWLNFAAHSVSWLPYQFAPFL